MIRHHPEPEMLLDYAAGTLAEPVALVLACHLDRCGACRDAVARMEGAGGAMLNALPPAPLAESALAAVFAWIDADDQGATETAAEAALPGLPAPLRRYFDRPPDRLRWRRMGSLETVRIPVGRPPYKARLVRMGAGRTTPAHDHRGTEYTAVLSGGFTDDSGHFLAGDFCVEGPGHAHQPVVDPDGPCLAIVVHDAPIRFVGPLTRLLNPLVS
jgi:putative transcriptional regulator